MSIKFINKDFSESCNSLGIETRMTANDDIFEIDTYLINQLRLEGLLRHLHKFDIYYYPNHDKVSYTEFA